MVSTKKAMSEESKKVTNDIDFADACENGMIAIKNDNSERDMQLKEKEEDSVSENYSSIYDTPEKLSFTSHLGESNDEMSMYSYDSTFSFIDQHIKTIQENNESVKYEPKQIDLISEIFLKPTNERNDEDLAKAVAFISECEAITMLYPGINMKMLCQQIRIKKVTCIDENVMECGSPIDIWFMVWRGEFSRIQPNGAVKLIFGQGHETKLKNKPQIHISTISPLELCCEYLYVEKDAFLPILKQTRTENVMVDGKVVKVLLHATKDDVEMTRLSAVTIPFALEMIKTDTELSELFFGIMPLIYSKNEKEFYDAIISVVVQENFGAKIMSSIVVWFNQNFTALIRNELFKEFWEILQNRVLDSGNPIALALEHVVSKKTPYISLAITRLPDLPLGFELVPFLNSNKVVNLDTESYAYKCGLRENDQIILANNILVKGIPIKALTELICLLFKYIMVVHRCPFALKFRAKSAPKCNLWIKVVVNQDSNSISNETKLSVTNPEEPPTKKGHVSFDAIKKSILASIPIHHKLKKNKQSAGYKSNRVSPSYDSDSLLGLHDQFKTTGYLKVVVEEGATGVRYYPVNTYTSVNKIVEYVTADFKLESNDQVYSLNEVFLNSGGDFSFKQLHTHTINLLYRAPIETRYYFKSLFKNTCRISPELEILKDSEFTLTDLDPVILARMWTFMDFCYYVSISPCQYYYFALNKPENRYMYKEVEDLQKRNNEYINFVICTIIRETTLSGRCKIIKFFLRVGEAAIRIGGFNMAYVLYCAFTDPDYLRLCVTRERLGSRTKDKLEEFESLMDPCLGISEYKEAVQKFKDLKQNIVPIVGRITTSTICCLDAIENQKDLLDISGYRCIHQKIQNFVYYHETDVNTPELICLKENNFPQELVLHILIETKIFELHMETENGIDLGENISSAFPTISASLSSGPTSTGTINQLMGTLLKSTERKMFEDVNMMKKCLKFLKKDYSKALYENLAAREAASIMCENTKSISTDTLKPVKARFSYIQNTNQVSTSTKITECGVNPKSGKPLEALFSSDDIANENRQKISPKLLHATNSDTNQIVLPSDNQFDISTESNPGDYSDVFVSSVLPTNNTTSEFQSLAQKRNSLSRPSFRRPNSLALASIMLRGLKSQRRFSSCDELTVGAEEKRKSTIRNSLFFPKTKNSSDDKTVSSIMQTDTESGTKSTPSATTTTTDVEQQQQHGHDFVPSSSPPPSPS